MTGQSFSGSWRIVWMSNWDQDDVEMEVPGHFTFGANRLGSFQFGLVQAETDWRIGGAAGRRIEFTWQGADEGDEVSGRGHAEIVDGELHGHLYIHLGDDSSFRAVRQQAPVKKMRKRKPG